MEHIDGFWGPIYALVVIFMCVTAVYLVAYYIELRDQRARRQSVRLSQVAKFISGYKVNFERIYS